MGEMRDSDWSRENLLRSDWSVPKGAIMTTCKVTVNSKIQISRHMTIHGQTLGVFKRKEQ